MTKEQKCIKNTTIQASSLTNPEKSSSAKNPEETKSNAISYLQLLTRKNLIGFILPLGRLAKIVSSVKLFTRPILNLKNSSKLAVCCSPCKTSLLNNINKLFLIAVLVDSGDVH